jgi:surface protein
MSKEIIKCTDDNIKQIVEEQIELLGNEADLNHLDVSNVTDMEGMFWRSQFNGNISNWNVSNVTNMAGMFGDSEFNGNISNWDVSNVTDMGDMFYNCPIPEENKPKFED